MPLTITSSLAGRIRGEVHTDILHRAAFARDASIYQIIPMCVVAPRDLKDVATVVRYAAENRIPIAARGAGSGLAGESLTGGIVLDMARFMNRIVDVGDDGVLVTCQPGAVLDRVNEHLARFGRKIGPDPSSGNRATIGGIVSNNSTGAHSLQYGYVGRYVERIEAVLADGSVVVLTNDIDPASAVDGRTSAISKQCLSILSGREDEITAAYPLAKRNRSGYNIRGVCRGGRIDLAKLLAGSEGTLAIFTEITLKTVLLPAAKSLLQLEFDSLEKMAAAVPIIVDTGVAACELMDHSVIARALDALPETRDILPPDAKCVLLVEHVGDSAEEVMQKIAVTDVAVGKMAYARRVFADPKLQKRVWKSRKDAVPLLFRDKRKQHPIECIEDVAVDHRKLGDYVKGLSDIADRHGVSFSYYGHAGDGELHVRPYLDLSEKSDIVRMQAIVSETYELAWSLKGSISGEHAVGLLRAAFLRRQYGDAVYEMFCAIKRTFDPQGIMNPGKVINPDPTIMLQNLRYERRLIPSRVASPLKFENGELEVELNQCNGCGVCLSREIETAEVIENACIEESVKNAQMRGARERATAAYTVVREDCGRREQQSRWAFFTDSFRMCPVYRALGEELGSSRAKANILNLWASGEIDDEEFGSDEFRKFLDLCVNCKACSLECPSGVDISKLMMSARAEYAKRKGLEISETLLARNRLMSAVGRRFAPISNLSLGFSFVRRIMQVLFGFDGQRRFPRFESGSFVSKAQKHLKGTSKTKSKIEKPIAKAAYFVDAYVDSNDHELGYAVIDVLSRLGVEVIVPRQRPAPVPAIVYGDVNFARKELEFSVRHLASAVRDGYTIVCSEPTAALCLGRELKYFVSGDDARLVSENTQELMHFLLRLIESGAVSSSAATGGGNFLYHLPCHVIALGGSATPQVMNELCGINITMLKAGCCGLAGTFGMQAKNSELSNAIARNLKERLGQLGAKEVITECAACGMQIEQISEARAVHPIKILARCI